MLSESELKDLAQEQAAGGPQPGEVYRHYKGGLYVVIARSIKEDTLEPLVTYRSNLKGTFWTRTVANFTERVPAGGSATGGPGPRFRREID